MVSGIETRNTVITTITGDSHAIDNSDITEEYRQFIVRLNTDEYIKRLARTYVETDKYYIYTSANSQTNIYIRMYKQDDLTDSFDVYRPLLIDYLNNNPLTIMEEAYTPITTKHTLIPSTTQTTQEPTFILPQPLRSVPNGICDRLYWDENKGHYCIEKRVDVFMVDNTYNYNIEHQDSTMIGFYGALNVGNLGYGTGRIIYSDFGEYHSNDNTISGVEKLTSVGNGDLKIFINKSRLNTYDNNGFKDYLKDNPITLYIALKTPEIIDLPHLNEKSRITNST